MKKKFSKKLLAMLLAVVMLGTMAVGVSFTVGTPFAEEEEQGYGQLDPVFYANAYPDIAASVGNDPFALWEHYADYGIYEGRIPYPGAQPGEFICGYIGINEDLAASATVVENNGATVTAGIHDLSDWTPEQLAALAQKQAAFDASGYVHVGWTETQVQEKLLSLKAIYPEGTVVGICQDGAGKILSALFGRDIEWMMGTSNDKGGMDLWLDKAGNRVLPIGYVESEAYRKTNGKGNIRDIRVGDALYTKGSGAGHVSVILSHDDKGITVVESNLNGDKKMHWGRRISWNELENGGNTIYQAANKWTEITHYKY